LTTIDNYDRTLKIQIDLSKTMGASLYWTGFHEFNEMRFLNRFLKEDMTFVDVGANQGEFALFVSKRLPKGRVLAFEPMSMFFDRLQDNVRINNLSNIRSFKLGLSDHNGEVPIYFNADNTSNHEGLASLYPLDSKNESRELIHLATMDDVVARESIGRIDFIKIDVEGSEWAVLRGAGKILKEFKPALMVELNSETAAKAGYNVADMVSWLMDLGYQPYQMAKRGLEPLVMRPFCNAIFLAR
jgi:FkbM family methyltransferase